MKVKIEIIAKVEDFSIEAIEQALGMINYKHKALLAITVCDESEVDNQLYEYLNA